MQRRKAGKVEKSYPNLSDQLPFPLHTAVKLDCRKFNLSIGYTISMEFSSVLCLKRYFCRI